MRLFLLVLAAALSVAAAEIPALATNATPEVDPTSVSIGLALLAGGVLMARARWQR
jgi:hypothetical protein